MDSKILQTFQHRDTQETLAVLDRLDLDTDKPSDEDLAKRFGYEEEYYSGQIGQMIFLCITVLSYKELLAGG